MIPALALKLPIAVIGQMLGVPESDRAEIEPLVRTTIATLEFTPTLEVLEASAEAGRGIAARFEGLIAERRSHPTEDFSPSSSTSRSRATSSPITS